MSKKLTSFGKSFSCVAAIFWLAIVAACLYGWVMNIVYLIDCDFGPSYKAEILRGLGIFVAPLGMLLGYLPNALGK